jgi:hypothetical protein
MKMLSKLMTTAALTGAMIFFAGANTASAQFSKAVVVLKGTVRAEQTGKAYSVKVSVREIGDKALEITASRSNSESGNYLVVLKPGKKYWLHLEGDNIVARDEMLETPATTQTAYVTKDFNVTMAGMPKAISTN